MPKTLTIDPVTRVEGHLAVHIDIESDRIVSARVSGEMFRGFETILRGRHPLDAQQITQRICGVCPVSHGVASSQAQEEAYGASVPVNGRLARNLIQAMEFIHSHIFHFYRMSLPDFLDASGPRADRLLEAKPEAVTTDPEIRVAEPATASANVSASAAGGQAASAIPGATAVEPAAGNAPPASEVSEASPEGAPPIIGRRAVISREPGFHLPILKHADEALDVRAMAHQAAALFAGKLPHAATLVPGGITEKVTTEKIAAFRSLLKRIAAFIDSAHLPDALALAWAFPSGFADGAGCSNFLACGGFVDPSGALSWLFPSGVLVEGELQAFDPGKITEDVANAWYDSPTALAPSRGVTTPAPEKAGAYSWIKAPRYGGVVMEVGPLARLLVAARKTPEAEAPRLAASILDALGRDPEELVSLMGRHLARAIECKVLADRCAAWVDELRPGSPCHAEVKVPAAGSGAGFTEAPRGALGHWITLRDARVETYQCVVPTTWNASPRDDKGTPGAIERALEGTVVADPENPVEADRVVRSFDPCIACAVH